MVNRDRPLTDTEHAAVLAVGVATAGFALLGFVNSFAAVSAAARPSFGALAPTVPLGIDMGIAIFAALDLVLARLDMRPKWVRLVPWSLTLATVYLNTAGQHTWFARIAHAVFPCLWVLAVEAGAHVIRVRAGLAAGTAMDRVRPSRWMLAPLSTVVLWRRMVLWEIRSYPVALARERDRVLARTELQDAYGWRWRWTAPRRTRALYRLGELAPGAAPESGAESTPEAVTESTPEAVTESTPEAVTESTPKSSESRARATRKSTPKSAGTGLASAADEARQAVEQGRSVPSARQLAASHHIGRAKAGQVRAEVLLASANGHPGERSTP